MENVMNILDRTLKANDNMGTTINRVSSSEADLIEEYFPNAAILGEQDVPYRLGLINMFGTKVGFIVNAFVNKTFIHEEFSQNNNSIIVDVQKVKVLPEDSNFSTFKNVYLVKYVPGGTMINEKTGEDQQTINYEYPIVIARMFNKKSTAYLSVELDGIRCITKNGFEHSEDSTEVSIEPEKKLDNNARVSLQLELAKQLGEATFFFASAFPDILRKAGIDNYKVFASTMGSFVSENLSPQFEYVRDVEIDGKKHPGIILFVNGRSINEAIAALRSPSKKKKSVTFVKKRSLTTKELNRLKMVFIKKAKEKGLLLGSTIPGIVEQLGLGDYKEYAEDIEDFTKRYMGDIFEYKKSYTEGGKTHSGVLFLKRQETERQEFLLTDSLFSECLPAVDGVKYGVINVCSKQYGFINVVYVDKKLYPDYVLDSSSSTIFNPKQVTWVPKEAQINTKENIYLVEFRVNGTVMDSKTNKLRPAIDYSFPIRIVKRISRNNCVLLSVKDDRVIIETYDIDKEQPVMDENFETILGAIKEEILVQMEGRKFIEASKFPDIAKHAGLDNFRKYAENVEAFVHRYFEDLDLKKNVTVNGIRYPGIVYLRDDGPEFGRETIDKHVEQRVEFDLSQFDKLFEDGKYIEYLSSDILEKVNFCDFSVEYMEKTLSCAAHMIFPIETPVIKLNQYQKEVFLNRSTIDFVKKWKHEGRIDSLMMEQCAESSFIPFILPEHAGYVFSLINTLGHSTSAHNDNYPGLTKRLSISYDKLLPYMFFVRACVQKTHHAVERCIDDYVQAIKTLRQAAFYTLVDSENQLISFSDFLLAVDKNIVKIAELSRLLHTSIISIYVDSGRVDALKDVYQLILPENDKNYRLVNLYDNYENFTEKDVAELFREGVSLQLIQKIVSLIWEGLSNEKELPDNFIKLLSWICLWGEAASVDEVLRYRIVNKQFTKLHKMEQLLYSFQRVCSIVQRDISVHILASYIRFVVCEDITQDSLKETCISVNDYWDTYSAEMKNLVTGICDTLSDQKEERLLRYIHIFGLDISNQLLLQDYYANWYLSNKEVGILTEDDIRYPLTELFKNKAYKAYIELFHKASDVNCEVAKSDLFIEQFTVSLIAMRRYNEAIIFIMQNDCVTEEFRDELTIRVIAEYLRNYGISSNIYMLFGATLSEQEAIELLLRNLSPTKMAPVNCLISIYCVRNEVVKAAYLYQIYHEKAERGFTRLYTQIRKCLKSFNAGLKNHYDVVEYAFGVLCPDDLIKFFEWAKQICIPNWKGYTPSHVFSTFYERIMDAPQEPKSWQTFYDHIIKRTDVNGWTIVICENVLFTLTGMFENRSGNIIHSLMRQSDASELPANFLPYVYEYIMNGGNNAVCRAMKSMLSKTGIIEAIKTNNIWSDNYSQIEEKFKLFCIERFGNTGDDIYYDVITSLGMQFDIGEIAVLAKTSGDKSYLYQLICRYFLAGGDKSEITTLLYDEKWSDMTSKDLAVLDILKMLYQSEEVLFDEGLFANEEAVYRFKHDCAKILSAYPEKTELNTFDRECSNIKHKLLVYSYIFKCLYDEDTYDKYELGYEELINDNELYKIYLKYYKTVLYAQLYWNQDYPFFYKRWRYLKLLIANTLSSGETNNKRILDAMEEHGHFQMVYEDTYKPFAENVRRFWTLSTMTEYDKGYLLFSLMIGRVNDFLKDRESAIVKIGSEEKKLLKDIVSQLDYREVNLSIYKNYGSSIKENRFDEVIKIAEVFSDYAVDCLNALRKYENDEKAVALFEKCALQEKPSHVIRAVFQVENSDFEKYFDMLIPLACSRQFIFLLYGSTRNTIVNRGKYAKESHYIVLTDYVSKYHPNEAKGVQKYLLALMACMEGNRVKAKEYIGDVDITSSVPEQWKREGELICRYANGEIAKFIPDKSISDSSLESERKDFRFAFIERLEKQLNIQKVSENNKTIKSMYERFVDTSIDKAERIRSAMELIVNYPRQKKIEEISIPSKGLLIFMVGWEISDPKYSLDDGEKISILFELYEGRSLIRNEKKRIKELRNAIIQRLKSGLTLSIWTRYRNLIRELLEEDNILIDYSELQKRILNKCADLMEITVSQEERYEGFCNLLKLSNDLESIYSRNVFDAIRKECKNIENGGRLTIEIENVNGLTDQKVYFLIRNIGKTAISFAKGDYYVTFRQEGYLEERISIDSISDLQSGYITGGNVHLIAKSPIEAVNVTLAVMKKTQTNEVDEIICTVSESLKTDNMSSDMTVSKRNRYDAWHAVVDSEMLFGRDKQKNDLEYLIPGGVTVLYGPSRIGKTSLMNWVKNKYATDKGNVLCITIGGEGGLGKESDYRENIINPDQPVPYGDDEKMSEYLLISTLVYGLKSIRRLKKPSKKNVDSIFIQQAIQILQDDSLSISDRYYELDQKLHAEDIELWLMLDEFQQVVEKWKKPKISCEFVRVCKMLLSPDNGETSYIKIIICGSDDLLRHMVLEDESVWRQTFPDYTRMAVEPLSDKPFYDMIRQDKKLNGTGVTYAESALETLYSYTGGVALYGKEICNTVLDAIEAVPEKYQGRTTIYSFDISEATQKLLNQQAAELDTSERAGILEIYDAVTKNLRADSDMQFLWYIAKWLHDNPMYANFPESVFYRNGNLLDENELHDSLAIAVARGILRRTENELTGEVGYTFRTIFYYFAFLGMAREHIDESKIFGSSEEVEISDVQNQDAVNSVINQFVNLSADDQGTVFAALYLDKMDDKAIEKYRKRIGNNHYGDNVSGSKIGKQNIVQINIQSISNTLNSIMTTSDPELLLKGIQELPRLSGYLPQIAEESEESTLSEERISRAMDNYVEDMEESLETSCGETGRSLTECWKILNFNDEKEFEGFKGDYAIPQCFFESLQFAYELELLFTDGSLGEGASQIDYSPVTIMYCKLIESLLKEYHIVPYSDSISSVETDLSYRRNGRKIRYRWGEVKRLPQYQKQKLTIGAFVYPIVNDADSAQHIVDLATNTPGKAAEWRSHASFIKEIRDIRNPSAHGNKDHRITLEQMKEISKILIEDGGFKRLITIVKEPI